MRLITVYLLKYVFNNYYVLGSTLGIGGHNGIYGDMVLVLMSLSSGKENWYQSKKHTDKCIGT